MLTKAILLLVILQLVATIRQECDNDEQCPSNSLCNVRLRTCKCMDGFIGQCNISAFSLTNDTITVEINNSSIQYFSISPLEVNKFMDIKINICQVDNQGNIHAYFWG